MIAIATGSWQVRHRYSFHFTNTPSTIAILHCGNFTSNFLITICFRRIIIPAREQEVKPRILKRIRRNLDFLHTLWSLQEQNVCGEILVNSYILQHFFQKNTADKKLLYSSYSKTGKARLWQ
ncbi:hypothetical protein LC612_38095 [Nostoc sp. CHAB 5834]|nr:hypothetical protein [Nostoc sp. CHAB 5834]